MAGGEVAGGGTPPAVDPRLQAYVDRFAGGAFFEAHEAAEALWNDRDGDPFLQGLIILAAAFVKARAGSAAGAAHHLRGAARYLQGYGPLREGFDVDTLLAHVRRCLDLLAAGAPPASLPPPEMPARLLPPPPPPPAASDAEVLAVLRQIAAERRAGAPLLPTDVKEAMLRLHGRAGRSRVRDLARGGDAGLP